MVQTNHSIDCSFVLIIYQDIITQMGMTKG